MEAPVKRKWLALSLMAVVLPVGLLLGFKLTGVLPDPPKPETITLEAVKWELERPGGHINMNERIESIYDENLAIKQSILVNDFYHRMQDYGRSDYIAITINVTATIQEGYIENVYLVFHENYDRSKVWVPSPEDYPGFYQSLRELSIVDWAYGFNRWWLLNNSTKAFIKAEGVNHPSTVHFWGSAHWILRSKNNQTHQIEIVSEVTYFNGTTYKKVVQPFHLKIGPDDNDSFDTAKEISEGTHSRLHLGGYDAEDYYKIHVDEGYLLNVYATSYPASVEPDFYLAIYSPEKERKNGSAKHGYSHSVSLVADSTGYWFIKTSIFENHGFYMLEVTMTSAEEGI